MLCLQNYIIFSAFMLRFGMLFVYFADTDHISVQNNVSQLLQQTTEAIQAPQQNASSHYGTREFHIFFPLQCEF